MRARRSSTEHWHRRWIRLAAVIWLPWSARRRCSRSRTPALGQLDPAAGQGCATRLRAEGIEDPGDPLPDPAVLARVIDAWRRIEHAMSQRRPQLLAKLGPPLPPPGVVVCRQIFGIPNAFAACLTRHRCAHLFPDELHYEDVRNMLADVDQEWWYNNGDWGDLPDLADDETRFDRLNAYAERLGSTGI